MVMRCIKTAMLGIAIVVLSIGWPKPAHAADVSFDFFYSNLSPHGTWLVSNEYGQVWQPRVFAVDWNPYYDGHWVYTDLGWAWVSDYSWGTIPYHYGTWVADPEYGWVWVPGYVWAPSWVVFRTGPDTIGWAPVSPRYSLSLSTSFSQPSAGPFVFVSTRDFAAPRIRRYIIPGWRSGVILENTRIVNGLTIENSVVVNRGLSPKQIEKASGQPIRERRIEQVRGIAPEPHVDRAGLRIDPQRMREGLRVTEPTRGELRQPTSRRQDGMTRQPRSEKQPGESATSRNEPQAQVQDSVTPRTNPQGQPRESLKPSGKSGQPLPPKGTVDKRGKKPPKEQPPPKKDSGS